MLTTRGRRLSFSEDSRTTRCDSMHSLANETEGEEFVGSRVPGFNFFFFLLSHHPSLKINLGENFFRSRMEFVSPSDCVHHALHSPTWIVKSCVSRIITDRKDIFSSSSFSSFFMILDRCSVTHYFLEWAIKVTWRLRP